MVSRYMGNVCLCARYFCRDTCGAQAAFILSEPSCSMCRAGQKMLAGVYTAWGLVCLGVTRLTPCLQGARRKSSRRQSHRVTLPGLDARRGADYLHWDAEKDVEEMMDTLRE